MKQEPSRVLAPIGKPLLPAIYLILVLSSLLFAATGAISGAPLARGQIEGGWITYANGDEVLALALEGEALWAATKGGGVVRWNTVEGSFEQVLYPQTDLASNEVRAVAIDGLGRKWFGTSQGVNMLSADGHTWTTYTAANTHNGLGSDDVTAVAVDCAGALWFGTTGGGISRFDGQAWQRYTTSHGLASNDVVAIAVDGDCQVWTGFGKAGGGVRRFDGSTWIPYTSSGGLASDMVLAIAGDNQGRVWFGTWGRGLSVFDGLNWQTYRYPELASNYVWAIGVEADGRVWCATGSSAGPDRGVSTFDGATWGCYTTADGLASDVVRSITHDAGKVWFGTEGGVSLLDGGDWTTYSTVQSPGGALASNMVTAIAFAPDGRTWFGTDGDGVSVLDPLHNTWTVYTQENTDSNGQKPWDGLAGNRISDIAFDGQGRAWIGTREVWDSEQHAFTDGGVSVFDGHTWHAYTQKNTDDDGRAPWRGLASNDVSAIAVDDEGRVWIGTGDLYDYTGSGLSLFDGYTWRTYHYPEVASDNITAIALDRARGRVWVVGAPYWISGVRIGGGVSIWDGAAWQRYEPSNSDLIAYDDDVRAVAVDSTGVGWVGAWDYQDGPVPIEPFNAVVNRFDGNDWTATLFPEEGYILSIAVDLEDRVWAGTSREGRLELASSLGGVKIFDGATWTALRPDNSGLVSNDIRTIAIDANRDVWISTWDRGVSRLHEAEPGPTETATPTPTGTPVHKHVFLPLILKE
jgi:ligand-binding sensor domain-containing protein